jgi:very-short-patch-repair endonuclease
MLRYNKRLAGVSRALRKNMTDAERHLWSKVRMRQIGGCQFYRQRIIGEYIVDFYCPRAKLVVEVDGAKHSFTEVKAADEKRNEYLKNKGLKIIRFNDIEVLRNMEGVVEIIHENVKDFKNPP